LSPKSLVHLLIEESAIAEDHQYEANDRDIYRVRRHAVHHVKEDPKMEISRVKITPNMFKDMCPALLAQLDMRACSEYTEEHLNDYEEKISIVHGM
jgi:zinc transporter 5